MKKEIKINIIGESGSGKTAIAQVIQNALIEHGFNPIFENLDGDNYSKRGLTLALNSIKDKSSVELFEIQASRIMK